MALKIKLLILSVTLTFASGACSTQTKSHIKEEVSEAAGVTNEDWQERKDSFIEKSENRISDIGKDLNSMQKKPIKANKDKKEKFNEDIDQAKDLVSDLRDSLNDLRKTNTENWTDEQSEFQTSLNKLENKFNDVRSKY